MFEGWGQFFTILLIISGVCLTVSLIGLVSIMRSVRRLNVPYDADFFTTMRHIPLILVLLLDLLDFALDIFSAPIIWIVLDRMGLPNLRNKAALEAIIPITNVIPTFTLSWIAARVLNLGEAPDPYGYTRPQRMRSERDAQRYSPAGERRRRTIDMDDRR